LIEMPITKPEELYGHDSEQIIIDGDAFTFHVVHDGGGTWLTFNKKDSKLTIWATVGWAYPVPLSITVDGDAANAFDDYFNGWPDDWNDYLRIVGRCWNKVKYAVVLVSRDKDTKELLRGEINDVYVQVHLGSYLL